MNHSTFKICIDNIIKIKKRKFLALQANAHLLSDIV